MLFLILAAAFCPVVISSHWLSSLHFIWRPIPGDLAEAILLYLILLRLFLKTANPVIYRLLWFLRLSVLRLDSIVQPSFSYRISSLQTQNSSDYIRFLLFFPQVVLEFPCTVQVASNTPPPHPPAGSAFWVLNLEAYVNMLSFTFPSGSIHCVL